MADSSGQPAATGPLLGTKLYIPRRRTALVARPGLIQRLDRGAEGKLTLVAAPAGFGKTTLLAEWVEGTAAGERPAAWLALDRGDNNLEVFWAYVVTALRAVHSEVGESALAPLRASQPPPIEWLVTALINEIAAIGDARSVASGHGLTLVLDDYHVIEAEPVHSSLGFLLDHLPPQMHVVVATRSDPPLPLARLRGRDELSELRAADLRFTPDEAATFLNEVMGLDLSASDVAALERRTEGWIAGLQLAALSMQGRDDVPGFVQAFAGDDRYVVDYLVEEVLERQPPHVRRFLLRTSILDRLCGPLCDAVTGRDDGNKLLEALERGNLFVVPLDDKRLWFRYHHLFADALRVRAAEELSDDMAVMHRRASRWCERNGQLSEAVHHALAAGDVGRAAGLVELAGRAMLTARQDETLLGWLQALPDEEVRTRPVLSVYSALALVSVDPQAAEERLGDAERLLDATAPADEPPDTAAVEPVVHDDAGLRSLPGMIAIVRAYGAGAAGDLPGVVDHARRAWELLPEDDHLWRGGAGGLLGLAFWTSGDLEAAYRAFSDAWASLRRTGDPIQEISGAIVLADIRTAQGRLREAARLCEQALQRAAGQGGPMPPPTADLYVGLSEVCYEHGDLDGASRHLKRSKELSEHGGLSEHRHRWYVAMARIRQATGDLDGALDLLDEAERLYVRSPAPDVRPVAAVTTRLWVREGRLAEALAWVRERGVSVDDELSYLGEFEHITLARVLLSRSTRDQAAGREAWALLERLREAADEGGRAGSLIEILALQALAHAAQGDVARALVPLERALMLAEPEGYVRIFVDEGQAMRALLRYAAARGIARSYPQGLLAAFDASAQSAPIAAQTGAGLVEPLTAREVEILRLIAAGMRNQQIADHLFISLATVKRHIANAYRKLGVGNRIEAVARANELHLL